jgi:hypothetical protein
MPDAIVWNKTRGSRPGIVTAQEAKIEIREEREKGNQHSRAGA